MYYLSPLSSQLFIPLSRAAFPLGIETNSYLLSRSKAETEASIAAIFLAPLTTRTISPARSLRLRRPPRIHRGIAKKAPRGAEEEEEEEGGRGNAANRVTIYVETMEKLDNAGAARDSFERSGIFLRVKLHA